MAECVKVQSLRTVGFPNTSKVASLNCLGLQDRVNNGSNQHDIERELAKGDGDSQNTHDNSATLGNPLFALQFASFYFAGIVSIICMQCAAFALWPTCEDGAACIERKMQNRTVPYNPSFVSPTSELSDEGFLFFNTMMMWLSTVTSGFGIELIVGATLVSTLTANISRALWTFFQLTFPVCLTIALTSQSVFGLPFLVFGLWKGGFPECSGYIMEAISCFKAKERLAGAMHSFNAIGTIVHHSMTACIICSIISKLFPLTRPLICPCQMAVAQHIFVVVKYKSSTAYIVAELLLEVIFEWEILANVGAFWTPHGHVFTVFGRGCALGMLASHWMYLLAAILDLISQQALGKNEKDPTPTRELRETPPKKRRESMARFTSVSALRDSSLKREISNTSTAWASPVHSISISSSDEAFTP